MTRRLESCERLLMMLSVKPSDKYSVSGSRLWLTNGKTAIESMATSVLRACRYMPRPTAPRTTTMTATAADSLCCLIPVTMYSALDGDAVESLGLDAVNLAAAADVGAEPMVLGGAVVSDSAPPSNS